MILDNEPITPTESYVLSSLLDKVINQQDIIQQDIIKKAIELKDLINNI